MVPSSTPWLTLPAFNQVSLAYNATKEERVGKLQDVIDAREAKYRVES